MSQGTGLAGEAVTHLMEERLMEDQAELEAARESGASWAERAGDWLNLHRRGLAIAAGGAILASVGLVTAARLRR